VDIKRKRYILDVMSVLLGVFVDEEDTGFITVTVWTTTYGCEDVGPAP